ncbi:uncharacterized protein LOC107012705 [Solanum pennellii]|uniref:Uncharacterized protein LOC107012705 n=1 Tax=Solanum pennellii TaxID=28526 RepID=A0ABM1GA55_SOLPN|nr:uncharacterized protein LOC107012705 [Solanum pennellii]XP_015068098.1 uncharacterized protein LOC107012705 [Solanum pennellii]XP_027770966.1 uncharacterized protein LOC107012705 [Solanum pennellii]
MDLWLKARSFAEEAAKRSQEFTVEAAKRTQELSFASAKLSDVVSEASKRSKEIAAEASKRSKEIVAEASKRADQIKFQIPAAAALSSLVDSSTSPQTASAITTPADLEKFGVTDDLREFVKGISRDTFQNVQLQDESEMSDIPTVSNIRQDLTEFQEKHAKLVLSSVKEISKLRYEICPRIMRERKFWRIYFILVNSHLAPYEKKYMDEKKIISAEKANIEEAKDISSEGKTSEPVIGATTQANKKAASSTADQDLDVFLLGEESDEGPDDGANAFDDDFDKL